VSLLAVLIYSCVMSCRRSKKTDNLLSFMSFKRSRTKPFHAVGRRQARVMLLMSSWREVQHSDLVVTVCQSPCNTLDYVPTVFLGNVLNLVCIHGACLLDVICQCNKFLSPGILLFFCESRPDSFYFWGSG